jgi:hypothetical protein
MREIIHNYTEQYSLQQELQDAYSVGQIEPIIIYMPQEELESLEEPKQDNKFQEEPVYEDL